MRRTYCTVSWLLLDYITKSDLIIIIIKCIINRYLLSVTQCMVSYNNLQYLTESTNIVQTQSRIAVDQCRQSSIVITPCLIIGHLIKNVNLNINIKYKFISIYIVCRKTVPFRLDLYSNNILENCFFLNSIIREIKNRPKACGSVQDHF